MKHLNYQIEMGDLKPKSIDRREVTITKHIEPYPIGYMQISALRIKDVETLSEQEREIFLKEALRKDTTGE